MPKNWSYIRDEWLKSTTIEEKDAKWALEALIKTEEDLFEIERKFKYNEDVIGQVRNLKKKVKETISSKETSLDDIALNTSNSNKVQISVPSNLNYLLKGLGRCRRPRFIKRCISVLRNWSKRNEKQGFNTFNSDKSI